jgi:GDPmannose 4,6-dehydratase
MTKKALVVGISGQDGAYLADLLLSKGYEVHGTSRDCEVNSFSALESLGIRDRVKLHSMALRDFRSVMFVVDRLMPDEVYNLSGQSSVGLSFYQPVETFESIAVGTLNLLDVLRLLRIPVRIFNSGSSECFGNTESPADENAPFHPRSPYATAKAAAHWAIANYREAYGMFACSSICANHESPLRPERFVTRKIVRAAVRIAGEGGRLNLGNLDIQRDWGWAPDYVECFWRMLQMGAPGDYVIASGETNRLSDFVEEAFAAVGLDWKDYVDISADLMRPSEISVSRLNPSRAGRDLGWAAKYRMREVVRMLIKHEMEVTGRSASRAERNAQEAH